MLVYVLDSENYYLEEFIDHNDPAMLNYTQMYIDIPEEVEDMDEFIYCYLKEVELGDSCERRSRV